MEIDMFSTAKSFSVCVLLIAGLLFVSASPEAPAQDKAPPTQQGDQGEKQNGQSGDQGEKQNGQSGDQGEKQNGQTGDQGEKQNEGQDKK